MNILSEQQIMNFMPENAHDFKIIIEKNLPSTNDYLLAIIANKREPLPKTALLAEIQTAGRGRGGSSWISTPGNILLSIYWPFYGALDKLYGLSLVIGIAVARVLKNNQLVDVQLKWPNDIYWHNSKMGGILIETKQHAPSVIGVVIGIGLNIIAMDNLQEQIDQEYISLEQALGHKVIREKIIGELLVEFNKVLTDFGTKGFEAFINEWKSFDCQLPSNSETKDLISKIIYAEKYHDSNQ